MFIVQFAPLTRLLMSLPQNNYSKRLNLQHVVVLKPPLHHWIWSALCSPQWKFQCCPTSLLQLHATSTWWRQLTESKRLEGVAWRDAVHVVFVELIFVTDWRLVAASSTQTIIQTPINRSGGKCTRYSASDTTASYAEWMNEWKNEYVYWQKLKT